MDLHLNTLENVCLPAAANDGPDSRFAARAQAEARRRNDGHSCFDIYRSECVSLTSTLFGGGDWHWRLSDPSGAILADCGGYRNQTECLAAVEVLRTQAGSATVSKRL
jgi:uncharacterized protein YegP (UPF0339 family)